MARSLQTAGVILITVPAIEFGGLSLLKFLAGRTPGYMDNPLRRGLFRAGHAHAGVLVLLALVGLMYLDQASLGDGAKSLVRLCLVAPPILMPAGFFMSIASPRAERPNKLIGLVYVGALTLAIAAVTLGVGLLQAA
ncbi:MAG: hypothetical protein ACRDJV_11115 [Actinomycetota bacterium]